MPCTCIKDSEISKVCIAWPVIISVVQRGGGGCNGEGLKMWIQNGYCSTDCKPGNKHTHGL